MQIKLEQEWLGNKPGSIVRVSDAYGKSMIARGYGISLESIEQEEPKVKIQRRDKDKMVANSLNK